MEESAFYIGEGDPADKQLAESFGISSSIHSSQQHATFRQANSNKNASVLTGVGSGERLFVACKGKALIHVYSWGKESPDQRIPVPEQLTCLALAPHSTKFNSHNNISPKFRTSWLLAGGSVSGKIFIWEVSSGLLLAVKEAHYQAPSVIKFSPDGTFLITGGQDARVMIWKTADLISIYNKDDDDNGERIKPYASITDHSLPITDLIISTGLYNDMKLYTASKDSTVRVYDLASKQLLTTFVAPSSVECLTKDPANRAIYIGLSDGLIRTIPLYIPNNQNIIESVGGCGKIVTLDNDPSLKTTFVHHQQQPANTTTSGQISVTAMDISLDGTFLVSGDSVGRVFVSDITTRQIVKVLKPLNSSISKIQLNACDQSLVSTSLVSMNNQSKNDKSHRLVPQFKRVLASNDIKEHTLYAEIPNLNNRGFNFESWINELSEQELEFKNLTNVDSSVKIQDNKLANREDKKKILDLESQLEQLSKAYSDLTSMHEELFATHTQLLKEKN